MVNNLFSPDGVYARVMNWLWNILVLSVLWLVCCMPIITIGASSTAAYYAASKVMRHKTGKLVSEFFASFRRNLRQSIPLSAAITLLQVVLVMECIDLYSDIRVPMGFLALFLFLLLVVCAQANYLWACLSRFDRSSFQLFRMAIVLAFRHFLTTILLLLLLCIPLAGIYFMPWGILIFPGLSIFVSTYPMEKILRQYSPAVAPDTQEAQKWYYQ